MDLAEMSGKASRALDDMHTMVGYVNDMRILTIVVTVTAYLIGISFLIYKCFFAKKNSPKREEEFENQRHSGNWRQFRDLSAPENESLKRKFDANAGPEMKA